VKLSVVIPARNEAGSIADTLRQLHRRLGDEAIEHEIVVVDDGSSVPVTPSDFDGARCDVQVIRHERSKGPAAARNTGLAACSTDFVAFLDSDDVWVEDIPYGQTRGYVKRVLRSVYVYRAFYPQTLARAGD